MRNPRNEPLADHDIAETAGTGDGPERRCVLSGRNAGRDEMLRLAISPTNADGVSEVLPDALAKARAYLQKWGAGPKGDPFVRFVDGEVEAGYTATTPVGGEGDVEPSDLPAGSAAVVVAVADDVPAAYEALRAFIAEQGNSPDGDGWEVIIDGELDGRREVVLPFH